MRIYIFENSIENKTSFTKAHSLQGAVEIFKSIYSHLSVSVPSHVREVLPEERIILDEQTGELHGIGNITKIKNCLLGLMKLYSPVNWIPPLQACEAEGQLSFFIYSRCLKEDCELYDRDGIKTWESILRVDLDNNTAFWNALQRALHIRIESVSTLEKLIGQ